MGGQVHGFRDSGSKAFHWNAFRCPLRDQSIGIDGPGENHDVAARALRDFSVLPFTDAALIFLGLCYRAAQYARMPDRS
jgi:hypothetical protein